MHQVTHRNNQGNPSSSVVVSDYDPSGSQLLPVSSTSGSLPTFSFSKPLQGMEAAKPVLMAAKYALALLSVVLVCVWSFKYRGGLAWNTEKKGLIFNWHPILMVFSFVFLYGEAIAVYRFYGGSKAVKKTVHMYMLGVASVLAAVGIWAAFRFHNESNPPIANLYSLHSWLGMATILGFILQWVVGFVTFWYPGGLPQQRSQVLPWHVFAGLFLYVLAIGTAELGILEKLTFLQTGKTIPRFGGEATLANMLGVVMAILGGLTVLLVTRLDKPRGDEGFRLLA